MSAVGDAKRLFFEGLAYLDDQNFSAAELCFRETLKLAQQSVPTLINLAIAQHKQNKIDDTALTSTRAIEIDPNNIEAYSMLATCQRQQLIFSGVVLLRKNHFDYSGGLRSTLQSRRCPLRTWQMRGGPAQ
jgi:tetratricopeptide (TPR) repeat protein